MSNERLILETFQTALRTGAMPASSLPNLPVKYVGIGVWQIPDDQKWLEVVWIPSNRQGDYWGLEKNYQGIFRLILHWPVDSAGAYSPLDIIDSISGYFTKNRLLNPLKITEPPDFTGPLEMGHEILYPHSLRYQCFRSA